MTDIIDLMIEWDIYGRPIIKDEPIDQMTERESDLLSRVQRKKVLPQY